jgi:hypothetical protein
MNTVAQPLSLLAWRERAQARERRTEYLARAYACRDMELRALDAHDAQLLGAMSIVWHVLAHQCAGVHNAAAPEAPP